MDAGGAVIFSIYSFCTFFLLLLSEVPVLLLLPLVVLLPLKDGSMDG